MTQNLPPNPNPNPNPNLNPNPNPDPNPNPNPNPNQATIMALEADLAAERAAAAQVSPNPK